MSPMQKTLTALAATALVAGVGFATAQSTDNAPPMAQSQSEPATDPAAQAPATDPASPMAPAEQAPASPAPGTSTSMPPDPAVHDHDVTGSAGPGPARDDDHHDD